MVRAEPLPDITLTILTPAIKIVTMETKQSQDSSFRSQKLPLPLPVERALVRLGADINLARRRRHLSQGSLAERIGASLSTIKRMENGDPRIPLHFIARALFVFGELNKLGSLLDTSEDTLGLALMNENLPKRVQPRRKPGGGL